MIGLFSRYKVGIWALLCALPILAALAGVLLDLASLAALGKDLRPLSPFSAGLSLLLAAGLFLAQGRNLGGFRRAAAMVLAVGVVVLGGYGLLSGQDPGSAHLSLVGFLGGALALGLLAASAARPGWVRQLAALAALTPLFAGGLVLFSYAAGIPLLYETALRPTSLPTALALFFLGHGLVALAGEGVFPMSLFGLDRAERPSSSSVWVNRLPLLGFILAGSLCAVGGALAMRAQVGTARRAARAQVADLAGRQAGSLDRWLEERFGDAEVIRQGGILQERLAARLAGATGDPALRSWMGQLVAQNAYESVTLWDASGRRVEEAGRSLPVGPGHRSGRP